MTKEDFDVSIGFAAIGSLCIFVAITILDKLKIYYLNEIVGGFLIVGFCMVFSSAAVLFGTMAKVNWDKEPFTLWVIRISIVLFFFVSFLAMGSYLFSLLGFHP